MDWKPEAVTAWATLVIAVFSVVTALVAMVAVWLQNRAARTLLAVQLAMEFDKRFSSEDMLCERQSLASCLLDGRDPDSKLLDFFESVGHYAKRGLLDQETLWNDFSYFVIRYWPLLKDFVRRERTAGDGDPELYANFEWLNGMMLEREARRHRKRVDEVTPSKAELDRFLKEEVILIEPRLELPQVVVPR